MATNFDAAIQISFGLASFILIYLGLNYGDTDVFGRTRRYPIMKILFVGLGLGMILLMMNSSYQIAMNNNTTTYTNNIVDITTTGGVVMVWALYAFLIFGFLILIVTLLADLKDLVNKRREGKL